MNDQPGQEQFDAAAVDVEGVHCPLCEYDLRGLTEPRCPECGYRFAWADLLDPERRVHPYLFEQHPRHNIWSFYRTAVGGLRPTRFWKLLRPQQPSRPKRLLLYWLICTLMPALLGAVLLTAGRLADHAYPSTATWMGTRMRVRGPPRIILGPTAPFPIGIEMLVELEYFAVPLFFTSAFLFGWTMLTCLSLLVFQNSMLKARVKSIHVQRCVFYSFDIGVWLASVSVMLLSLQAYIGGQLFESVLFFLAPALFIFAGVRLWLAYRNYLAFDHPFLVMLASQIIVALAASVILLNMGNAHML